jgi:hypothetical protein
VFDSWQGQDSSLLNVVQTDSGSHPACYPMDTIGSNFRGYSGRGVKLTTHLHLVSRSKIVELYLHSPIYLLGVVLNKLSMGTALF